MKKTPKSCLYLFILNHNGCFDMNNSRTGILFLKFHDPARRPRRNRRSFRGWNKCLGSQPVQIVPQEFGRFPALVNNVRRGVSGNIGPFSRTLEFICSRNGYHPDSCPYPEEFQKRRVFRHGDPKNRLPFSRYAEKQPCGVLPEFPVPEPSD